MTSYRLTHHDPTAHRHAVELDATVRVSGAELRVRTCRVRSLSLGGALIEIDRLPIGTLVNLTFGVPGVSERLSLDAVVYWSANDRVSVLFDSLRAWEVWVLWRYLESLDSDTELDDELDGDADSDEDDDDDELDGELDYDIVIDDDSDDSDDSDDDDDRETTQQIRIVEAPTPEP